MLKELSIENATFEGRVETISPNHALYNLSVYKTERDERGYFFIIVCDDLGMVEYIDQLKHWKDFYYMQFVEYRCPANIQRLLFNPDDWDGTPELYLLNKYSK